MNLIEERLTNLWLREATPMNERDLKTDLEQAPHMIGVTFTVPMMISGAMLKPGRYIFQVPHPHEHPNHVEIFNGDHTQLVANIMIVGATAQWGRWN
jgi:hypothetical protein